MCGFETWGPCFAAATDCSHYDMLTGSWLDHTLDSGCVFKSNSRSAQIIIRKRFISYFLSLRVLIIVGLYHAGTKRVGLGMFRGCAVSSSLGGGILFFFGNTEPLCTVGVQSHL